MDKILVTGVAGFIGFHVANKLLNDGLTVIGIDNLNEYYDVNLKKERLKILANFKDFIFLEIDIKDKVSLNSLFHTYNPQNVIHLAAQAGVRYSKENPEAYAESNLVGFLNILEACRNYPVKHLIYASSSSVYGGNTKLPYAVEDKVDHPVSLYAATKKANELMAHAYSHLYGIPSTGLRFFTVYGPWGRPDMAYFSFTKAILEGKTIQVYNYGDMERDFTYIDDIVESLVRLIDKPPVQKSVDNTNNASGDSNAPYKIYNIGNRNPVKLDYFIRVLEDKLGVKANKEYLEMQSGDVLKTCADVTDLENTVDFRPNTSIEEGLEKFVSWYRTYYHHY